MTDTIDYLAVPENPDDMERYVEEGQVLGEPVDMKPVRTTFADVTALVGDRKPIIPAWMRSRDGRRTRAQMLLTLAWYYPAFHAWHTPAYLWRLTKWAPRGAYRWSKDSWRWAYEMETWAARQRAVTRDRYDEVKGYVQIADKHRRGRVPVFFLVLAALIGASLAIYYLAPLHWQIIALAIAVTVLARAGRPADQAILDRVTPGKRFVRLTAEMVRQAFVRIGVPGIKELADLDFPMPVHEVGPGYLARVNLPPGVIAVKVLERRAELSSAMRLPIDQVWPEAGPDHAGQVDLWVGREPSSKMGQPKWALASPNARTSFFEAYPFATDPRQRPVSTSLFEVNFLMGGAPGSGKSYAARALATIALLDPTCEIKIAEFKGTGDFLDVEPLCSTYVCGVDDEAFAMGAGIIDWVLAECERRGKLIKAAKKRGEAPLGKVTPELASRPGSGLHPVFILIDEVHELFMYDPATAKKAERAIRRGRAFAINLCLATQIPDKDSVPPNITRCVTVRWCLAVVGQVENDMILGTGAYKRGLSATVYRPKIDAGWGIVTGLETSGSARSFFPDPATSKAILARATQLRGGQVVGEDGVERATKRDTLADVIRVFGFAGRPSLQWVQLAELMSEHMPEAYEDIKPGVVSSVVRAEGIKSRDVKVDGEVLKGCYLDDVRAAIERREVGSGSGSQGVLDAS